MKPDTVKVGQVRESTQGFFLRVESVDDFFTAVRVVGARGSDGRIYPATDPNIRYRLKLKYVEPLPIFTKSVAAFERQLKANPFLQEPRIQ